MLNKSLINKVITSWMLLCVLKSVVASSDRPTEEDFAQLRCIHMPSIDAAKGGVLILKVPMSGTHTSVTLAQYVRDVLLEQGKLSSATAKVQVFLYTKELNKSLRDLTPTERTEFWSRVTERDKQLGRTQDLSRLPILFADVLRDYVLILHIEETVSKL